MRLFPAHRNGSDRDRQPEQKPDNQRALRCTKLWSPKQEFVGSRFEGRYSLAGQYLGWSANGRFTPKQDQPSKVVFFLPLGVAVYLTCITVYIARGERLPRGEAEQ